MCKRLFEMGGGEKSVWMVEESECEGAVRGRDLVGIWSVCGVCGRVIAFVLVETCCVD